MKKLVCLLVAILLMTLTAGCYSAPNSELGKVDSAAEGASGMDQVPVDTTTTRETLPVDDGEDTPASTESTKPLTTAENEGSTTTEKEPATTTEKEKLTTAVKEEYTTARSESSLAVTTKTVVQATKKTTEKTTKSVTKSTTIEKTIRTTAAYISKKKAKAIALERAGVVESEISKYIIEREYDDDANRWEYEIEFNVGTTENDVEIDAETGKVLRFEREEEKDSTRKTVVTTEPSTSRVTEKQISRESAKQIALEYVGVTEDAVSEYESELDYDDDTGRWEYEIGFRVGAVEYELTLDANNGTILKSDREIDD